MEITVFQMPLNLFLLMEFNEMIHKQEQLSLVFFVTYVCLLLTADLCTAPDNQRVEIISYKICFT